MRYKVIKGERQMTDMQTIRQPLRKARVIMLDGRCIATNHFGPCGLDHLNLWGWVSAAIAAECECSADDVHCVETVDGDFISADNLIVAYLED